MTTQRLARLSRAHAPAQAGHLLVGLVVMVAIMLIMLMVTSQSWSFIIRRDTEAEMIFRGEQYAKAIEFYKKETNAYPMELKLLIQPGPHRHRFIRHLWPDPVSKDGKWGLLYLSPNGQGFVNPYASRSLRNRGGIPGGNIPAGGAIAGGPAGTGLTGLRGGTKSRFGQQNQEEEEAEDDSLFGGDEEGEDEDLRDLTPGEAILESRGGDVTGLPIVGVVHKKRETGIKLYRNIATLNDWAFTLMAETDLAAPPGQQQNTMPPTRGLGDSSNPIFRPSDKRPDEPTAPPGKRNMVDDMRRALQKELDEKKRLEEERRRQGEDPSEEPSEDDPRYRNEGDQPDPNGDAADEDDWDEDEGEIDPNAPADPNHPVDPNHPADPNHPVDPNHPADPNHP